MKVELVVDQGLNFESSHRLVGYKGKCNNLHGHSYNTELRVMTNVDENTEGGMELDFGDVKKTATAIIDELDHAYIYNQTREDPIADLLKSMGLTTYAIDTDPTVENLVQHVFNRIKQAGFDVSYIRIWETRKNSAIFRG